MIFFDIDGTLVDHKAAEREAALSFLLAHKDIFSDSSEEFVRRWKLIADKHIRRYLEGEITFQEQRRARIKEIFSHHQTHNDAEADKLFSQYLKQYEESWKLYADVKPCLSDLTGLPLGIISNGDSKQQRQKLIALGIAEHFSTVVISGDIDISKPDSRIFHASCKAAGEEPEECVYVGDDLNCDTEGSILAGLKGIWLNRNGKSNPSEILMISTLQELIEALSRTTIGWT